MVLRSLRLQALHTTSIICRQGSTPRDIRRPKGSSRRSWRATKPSPHMMDPSPERPNTIRIRLSLASVQGLELNLEANDLMIGTATWNISRTPRSTSICTTQYTRGIILKNWLLSLTLVRNFYSLHQLIATNSCRLSCLTFISICGLVLCHRPLCSR
jgi:hypothetical protein